ncbi:MAG TPA: POTRA domain-containing protein, partial [Myxococcota bacterium]|nr:POTRA domain-containing protein [Myxococcota bacterium]
MNPRRRTPALRHLRTWVLALALLGLAPAPAGADDPGEPLAAVVVRGNKRVENDAIRVVLQSQPGEPLSRTQLAADLKAIYGLGYFADVRAELEDSDEGPKLVFVVTEKPSIASVDYRGNEEVDNEKLKEVVDIQPLSVLDVAKIRANEVKIRDLYVEKGFFLAEVTHELKPAPDNSVALTFVVHERAKIQVKRITFIGNLKVAEDELESGIETREGSFWSWLTSSGTYKEEGLKRDVMRIQDYYYNHGYLNVKVSEPLVEISRDRQYLYVTIPIEEGEMYRFGQMAFSGDLLVRDEDLRGAIRDAIDDGAQGLVLSEALERRLLEKLSAAEVRALMLEVLGGLLAEVEARLDAGVWEEDAPPRTPGEELYELLRAEIETALKTRILSALLAVQPGEI